MKKYIIRTVHLLQVNYCKRNSLYTIPYKYLRLTIFTVPISIYKSLLMSDDTKLSTWLGKQVM